MRKNFEALRDLAAKIAPVGAARDRRFLMRAILGALLLANLIAVWFVVSPLGGSTEDLEAQAAALRSQVAAKKAALDRTRSHATKVEKTREEETKFEAQFFTDRRVASSAFVSELVKAAKDSGIRPKEHTFLFEPVEGSDTLSMMTINASYEGTYADLVHFINRLDRSSRFLILDSLTATPQQSGGLLNVTVKLNAFVRESAAPLPAVAQAPAGKS